MTDATIGLYVTYYNEREFLTELIRSVLSEPNRPEEIIIYDDCSSFPARDFVPKDVAIKVIRGSENRGPAFGRNRLLEYAGTQYVHFHDSDDFFLPGWSTRLREVIRDCAPEAIFTETAAYIDNQRQPELEVGLLAKLKTERDLLGFCLENVLNPASGTYSRKLLLSMGGYPEALWQAEDYAFHIRLATRCSSYAIITEPLVGVRIRSNSRSSNKLEVYRDALKGLKLLATEIPESHKAQLADAAIAVCRRLYQLGDREGLHVKFSWATSLGRAQYRRQPWGYRVCAKVAGPFFAEMVSTMYGKLPKRTREAIRSAILAGTN